ncbi:GNAT family N-acetyltransferase [Clostridium lacusfryxellense]|uniref:GNAT family N-acetyltransferase n=1 Tax=Clostridium lacusfryxellense TaxID=205328 RepID=UPI001C0CDBD2|nr:GNAT family N-acetyltransferase [Clostridium lacusfryxellense]MBU3110144.1 N-acetyltransferase [Clostridium lacusfryxellense]
MKITFQNCEFKEIKEKVSQYYTENRITVDSFWEDQVLESSTYIILAGVKIIGFFAIHHKQLLTLFNVDIEYIHYAEELFNKAKHYEEVFEAFIPTGDELFLSLALDDFSKIEKQAYFSVDSQREIKSYEINKDYILTLATVGDIDLIKQYSDNFFEEALIYHVEVRHIYIARLLDEVVGFGIINYGRVVPHFASIGMFVRAEYRCQGIATNILLSLKKVVHAKGLQPISGCWYYNHNSKKSAQSAGLCSKSRLLRIHF